MLWVNARLQLLDSMVHQKLGLFRQAPVPAQAVLSAVRSGRPGPPSTGGPGISVVIPARTMVRKRAGGRTAAGRAP